MNDSLVIEGRWWIFGQTAQPHFGTLTYHPETGLRLDAKIPTSLNKPDGPSSTTQTGSIEIPDVVIGRDKHDKPISLLTVGADARTSRSGGLVSITTQPSAALVGYEVSSWPEARFDMCGGDFTLLHNWVGRSRLKDGDTAEGERTLTIKKPETIEFELPKKVRLSIWQKLETRRHLSGLEMTEDDCVEFHFEKPLPVRELLRDYVHAVRRLLTFLTGYRVFSTRIYVGQLNRRESSHTEFLQQNQGITYAMRELLPQQMLVPYAEIRDHLSDIFVRWFAMEQQVRDCLNLYFATIFGRQLYSHQRFLFLAQALEVYHRLNPEFTNQAQPKAEFKKRKNRILDAVPDEKEWLTEKLAHANEKTLAQRVEELLGSHTHEVSEFIKDPQEFGALVKNTRNHFTHYSTGKDRMEKVASGADLLRLTDRIRTLLEICLLKDLGITGAPVKRLVGSLHARSYFSF